MGSVERDGVEPFRGHRGRTYRERPSAYDQIVSRRVVWIVLAMIAIATTGFLLAVLGPRSSDELPPRTVTVEKTITMPPGTPTVPPGMATVP